MACRESTGRKRRKIQVVVGEGSEKLCREVER
jgi:hypothetical protein